MEDEDQHARPRVEVSVANDNQFRGPEDLDEFANPAAPLGGRRYQSR
jgi:hypothetical protein